MSAAAGPDGEGWEDASESPDVLASLAERVGAQQRRASASPLLNGKVGRGQHQKQLLGAFGTLTIDERIPLAVKHGPFATERTYRVACRISNGQPCPYHDQAPDVRGVAIKLFSDGVETDLVMTNEGGRSHARNAVEFTDLADILVAAQLPGEALDAVRLVLRGAVSRTLGLFGLGRAAAILAKETVLRRVESMATEHYWGSVVKLGRAAVKYSLHPHPSTRRGSDADPRDPSYLREDLRRRLAKGPLRFELSLQLFTSERRTPVGDASVAWRAPLVRVGELRIDALPSPQEEVLIDRMAFNPGNGFEPLGITHARKVAYAASAKNRNALPVEQIRPYFADAERVAPRKAAG